MRLDLPITLPKSFFFSSISSFGWGSLLRLALSPLWSDSILLPRLHHIFHPTTCVALLRLPHSSPFSRFLDTGISHPSSQHLDCFVNQSRPKATNRNSVRAHPPKRTNHSTQLTHPNHYPSLPRQHHVCRPQSHHRPLRPRRRRLRRQTRPGYPGPAIRPELAKRCWTQRRVRWCSGSRAEDVSLLLLLYPVFPSFVVVCLSGLEMKGSIGTDLSECE